METRSYTLAQLLSGQFLTIKMSLEIFIFQTDFRPYTFLFIFITFTQIIKWSELFLPDIGGAAGLIMGIR